MARAPMGGPFWRLFASSSTSNLSDGILQAALPLLAATLTRDPVAVAALGSLAFLPWLLFAFPAGTLVDRVDRRRATAGANLVRAVALAGLAAAVLAGHASMPLLYVVAFALGCAETVYDNAARAMLPVVVTRDRLERGNSLLLTAESVGNIFLGAPVGAWLFAVAVSLPLWADAGGYLLAAGLVLAVTGSFGTAHRVPTTMRQDMREGLGWLLHHPFLRSLMLVTGFQATAFALVQGILVLYALQVLHLSERGFGLMLAAAGVGAVVGAMASPYLTRLLGRTHAMGVCGVLSAVVLLVMGLWPHVGLATACYAVSAAAVSAFNVQVMSVRQVLVPADLFGRVQGAYRTVIWGGIPVGTFAGGLVARWTGLPSVFVLSGVVGTLVSVVVWWLLHAHRDLIAAGFADQRVDEPAGSLGRRA